MYSYAELLKCQIQTMFPTILQKNYIKKYYFKFSFILLKMQYHWANHNYYVC